jgi:hypothetical protein
MISSETDRHSGRRDRDYISVFSAAAVKPEGVKLPASAAPAQTPSLAFAKPPTWTYTQLQLL